MRREKPCVPDFVVKRFQEKEMKALQMIKESSLKYKQVGIFGSYARNEYKATSDIDIIAIVDYRPKDVDFCLLRELLDGMGVQLIYSDEGVFEANDIFSREIQRDYIRRL